jgi:hypothetical protein
MEDLGRLARIWPEADVENSDFETVIVDLLDAQYAEIAISVRSEIADKACCPISKTPALIPRC